MYFGICVSRLVLRKREKILYVWIEMQIPQDYINVESFRLGENSKTVEEKH